MDAGTVCRMSVVGLSVKAPNTPATTTQLRKKTLKEKEFFLASTLHSKPDARKALYSPAFCTIGAAFAAISAVKSSLP